MREANIPHVGIQTGASIGDSPGRQAELRLGLPQKQGHDLQMLFMHERSDRLEERISRSGLHTTCDRFCLSHFLARRVEIVIVV